VYYYINPVFITLIYSYFLDYVNILVYYLQTCFRIEIMLFVTV